MIFFPVQLYKKLSIRTSVLGDMLQYAECVNVCGDSVYKGNTDC